MDVTALPVRLIMVQIMGKITFGVWSTPLDCVVFSHTNRDVAATFLVEMRQLINSGMSHGAAVALLYSVR